MAINYITYDFIHLRSAVEMARRVAGSPGHFLGLSHQRLWTLGTFHPAVRGIGQQRFASEFDAQLDIDLATDIYRLC